MPRTPANWSSAIGGAGCSGSTNSGAQISTRASSPNVLTLSIRFNSARPIQNVRSGLNIGGRGERRDGCQAVLLNKLFNFRPCSGCHPPSSHFGANVQKTLILQGYSPLSCQPPSTRFNVQKRIKRPLLYRLSYQPANSTFGPNRGSNPGPTPKAFGAALPTELPTRKFNFRPQPGLGPRTNPEGFRGCSTD